MTRISQKLTAEPELDDEAAITPPTAQTLRWTALLVWILRLSAILCMVRGLSYWAELLGMFDVDFTERPVLQQGAIVFFAIIYCFAAVGLWLAAAWGAAVWILALLGEIAFFLMESGIAPGADMAFTGAGSLRAPFFLMLGLVMVAVYLAVFWLASRED